MIWAGMALILLVPLIVSGETVFPLVVGKELYFRSIVAIVFVAWTVLAVLNPDYRPRRSTLLTLLGVALGVAVLSALLGVSVVRSFFSTYERMGGVLGQLHWFALAVVLVAVVRGAQWHLVLNMNLAVGMVIAVWAVSQHFGVEAFLWEWAREGYGRVTASLGNPIHLGAYVLVNCLVSAGLFARSLIPGPASSRDGSARSPDRAKSSAVMRLSLGLARSFWAAGALLNGWVVTLSGARGAFLGLLAALAAVAVLFAFVERRRIRLAMCGVGVSLAATVVLFVVMVVAVEPNREGDRMRSSNPLVHRVLSFSKTTIETRLAAWDAALDGYLERPFFGWGPENYIVVLGRHASGVGADMRAHDNAHGRLAEEMATRGSAGVVSHLAIWTALLVVGLRTARRLPRRERVLLVFAGGALVGYFAQSVVSPETGTGTLQFILLLAFVATLSGETRVASLRPAGRLFGKVQTWFARLRPRVEVPKRVVGVVGVVLSAGLASVGLWANSAALSAAKSGALAVGSSMSSRIAPHRTREFFAAAIDAYEPMANQFRLFLFQYGGYRWRFLRAGHRAEAVRLLELMDAEAVEAQRDEPENWEVPLNLAELYAKVGVTNPEYRAMATRYIRAAQELAPNRVEVRALFAPGEARPERRP